MFVTDNIRGTIHCSSFEKYKEHMKKCMDNHTGNEIWCSLIDEPNHFPCLAILIKNEQAVVNYFSNDNNEMFASVGDLTNEGSVEFENGQYEVAAYQIISIASALECALQFFHSPKRPSCIEWEEL